MDFYRVRERSTKNGVIEVYPDFRICRSKDLMVRGKSFYAIWDEAKGLWSTDEYDVQRLVDETLYSYTQDLKERTNAQVVVRYLGDFSSNSWLQFRSYVNHLSDSSSQLDESLTFKNTLVKKEDYVSKRLPYSLADGDISAYNELMTTLYDEDERAKIEWAIGSIISGDSRYLQKFCVFYGAAGTGKSTIINLIEKLFVGYVSTFEAKALTGANNSFSTEVFRNNPLVAIQHDGDLSKIEDNTKLNSIVSHEEMVINEKFKASYSSRINAFLFMGTNKAVKITDSKSGIIRRLIDIRPSGKRIPESRYHILINQLNFELGAIAKYCLDKYRAMGKDFYSGYIPVEMMLQTDVFYNFIEAYYDYFVEHDGVTLTQAYSMYKQFCEETLVEFKLPQFRFREELKNYFSNFDDRISIDGVRLRSWYSSFKKSKFAIEKPRVIASSLVLDKTESLLDAMLAECPAQYANEKDIPSKRWADVDTKLSDIDTTKVHYVKPGLNHIVIDFDLKDDKGAKCAETNIEAAQAWPSTYAEFSKGGSGIHLHYIYDGDVAELSRVYSDNIEIKVFTGDSSLRRKLTLCNNVPVATISTGLPLKEKKVINQDQVKSEKALRELVKRNLRKEIHPGTKPSIDFIFKILEDAYNSDLVYDLEDMRQSVLTFANNSTNQALYCLKVFQKMHFASEEKTEGHISSNEEDKPLVFFDCEVFPNLFVVCWKYSGPECKPVRMINPTPSEIEQLISMRLVGFNCRKYDNHILYGALMGYSNAQLFKLSQSIVNNVPGVTFGEAYNLSYTDVYDFCSKKQTLKKWEIELGIHHQELGLPWEEPVDPELWNLVAEYCDNDVIATEEVFKERQSDFVAREILASLSGLSVNDKTNSHTTRIIFGTNKHPQGEFVYTDLSETFPGYVFTPTAPATTIQEASDTGAIFSEGSVPAKVDPDTNLSNDYFNTRPTYTTIGKSQYRGEDPSEGGYVYVEEGMYSNVALLDVASLHPTSAIELNIFGPYTKNFKALIDARLHIKHHEYDEARKMFDGKLAPYLGSDEDAESLSYALKIAINSVYGLTSAKYENPFRDIRNVDNIVAKRGALFMIDLKHFVQERGFTVAHIKTDSIKIPNATPEIIDEVMEFGQKYGYTFEHEATYEKLCIVNKAVYIAKTMPGRKPAYWTATGAQFQQPYVFKKMFSKEPITFADLCETKAVTTALYLDFSVDHPAYQKNEDEKPHFVGRVGTFCPMVSGSGGGALYREKDGKFMSAVGTSGYLWMEAEMVQKLNKTDSIDMRYFDRLVDAAYGTLSKYGDVEQFLD